MNTPLNLLFDEIDTPLGPFALVADLDGCLRASGFTDGHARMERQLADFSESPGFSLARAPNPGGLSEAITRYFAGDLAAIDCLPIVESGTQFQRAVWRALREIPCGETWSYAQLAQHIGRPTSVRAVGLANGANPVGVVVPCHRVIGANGALTGYGAGLERKRWLLAHEGHAYQGPTDSVYDVIR